MIIYDRIDFNIYEDSAISIGKFDGVHLGHQMLVRKIVGMKKYGLKSVVFTFEPPAHRFFMENSANYYDITTKEEKRQIFEKMGVDYLIEFPFNELTSQIAAERFIEDILVGQAKMKYIVAGEDIHFGYKAQGNMAMLEELSAGCGYKYEFCEKMCFKDEIISSSRIREKLIKGDMETVSQLLGRDYSIYGEVVTGNQIGRTIKVPTANIEIDVSKVIPLRGVYFSRTSIDGKTYNSITNIGVNPTIDDKNKIKIETHLIDEVVNLYGRSINISLLHYKRGECEFESIDVLKKTIMKDMSDAIEYFKM